ncbi:MAG: YueI family protein [Sporomusa sp.]
MDDTRDVAQVWNKKDKLEQTLAAGMHGAPEIKKAEKRTFLGVFRERVIIYLTQDQVKEAALYPEIIEAFQHPKFAKLLINGATGRQFTAKYQKLAQKMQKTYSIIADAHYAEAAGLVAASNDAVDVETIAVQDRLSRLQKQGASVRLIGAAGKKVCSSCLSAIVAIDPREKVNYSQLTWLDRLTGERCPAHEDD